MSSPRMDGWGAVAWDAWDDSDDCSLSQMHQCTSMFAPFAPCFVLAMSVLGTASRLVVELFASCRKPQDTLVLDLAELFKWRDASVLPDVMHTSSGPVDMPTLRRAALFMEALLYEEAWRSDRHGWKDVSVSLTEKQPALAAVVSSGMSLTFWGHVSMVRSGKSLEVARFAGIPFYLTDSCSNVSSECFCPAWAVPHDETAANLMHAKAVVRCTYNASTGTFGRAAASVSPVVQAHVESFDVTVHRLQPIPERVPTEEASPSPLCRTWLTDAEREKAERDAARASTKAKGKGKAKAKAASVPSEKPEKRKAGKDSELSLLASIGPAGAQHAHKNKASGPAQPKQKKDKSKPAEGASHLLR